MNESSPLPSTVQRRRWPWVLLVVGLLVVIPIAALVTAFLYTRAVSQRELREAIAETDRLDPGWQFADLEARQPPLPPEKNAALQVMAVRRLLPANWPTPPQGEQPGPTLDEMLTNLQPQQQLNQEQLRELRAQLATAAPALKAAYALVDLPQGRYPIPWRIDFISTTLSEVQESRAVARLLAYDALLHEQEGDLAGACRDERALINVGRAIGDEYTLLVLLIRTALLAQAVQSIERMLAQGEPEVRCLQELQELLQREDEETEAVTLMALRGERALAHRMMEAIEAGNLSLSAGMGGTTPSVADRLEDAVASGTLRHSHAVYLQRLTAMIQAAQLPEPEQSRRLQELEALPRDRTAVLANLLMPAMAKVMKTVPRKQAQLRSAVVALALERYRHEHGQWPTSLERLVPDDLPQVPADPYDGRPLRFRRLDDGVVVYSVGPDGEDNGGHLDRQHPLEPGTDLGLRLWDVAKRRQAPPQSPPE